MTDLRKTAEAETTGIDDVEWLNKKVIELTARVKECRYLPGKTGPRALYVSWANVFRELRRARSCAVKPFRMQQCKYG